jgi:hypothetical protein
MLRKLIAISISALVAVSVLGGPANASTRDYVKAWGKFATQTYSGVGDDVISLPRAIKSFIVEGSHSGTSNFAVWALDNDGGNNDLLFNEVGSFQGITTTGMMGWNAKSKFLEVTADGPWTLTLKSLEKAQSFTRSGNGQAVMKYSSGFRVWSVQHSGTSNFSIWQYCSNGNSELLVNDIGNYSGRKKLISGKCILVVEADGAWSLRS